VRKYVTLVDDTGYAVSLTLWSSMNSRITTDDLHKVISVKNARVSDFGGKSLNAADDPSSLYPDLNHERVHQLEKWYSELQMQGLADVSSFVNLTKK
jgi:hypothetical protein